MDTRHTRTSYNSCLKSHASCIICARGYINFLQKIDTRLKAYCTISVHNSLVVLKRWIQCICHTIIVIGNTFTTGRLLPVMVYSSKDKDLSAVRMLNAVLTALGNINFLIEGMHDYMFS